MELNCACVRLSAPPEPSSKHEGAFDRPRRQGDLMKRSVVLILLLLCIALPAATRSTVPVPPSADALQAWIAAHAIAIRSIDPMDEDFSDLEPLVAAIGSARV